VISIKSRRKEQAEEEKSRPKRFEVLTAIAHHLELALYKRGGFVSLTSYHSLNCPVCSCLSITLPAASQTRTLDMVDSFSCQLAGVRARGLGYNGSWSATSSGVRNRTPYSLNRCAASFISVVE